MTTPRDATTDGGWIVTHSGVEFSFENPTPEMIRVEDIAHALSLLCRFGGHTRDFYSVAQHCLLVATIVEERPSGSYELVRTAFLHDASEAYVQDLVRPIKRAIGPRYTEIEDRVQAAIRTRFDLHHSFDHPEIHYADLVALVTERRDLTTGTPTPWAEDRAAIVPREQRVVALSPFLAEPLWLNRAAELAIR